MPKKILIVDDEQDIRESMQLLVKTLGYAVKAVGNGREALRVLGRERFDLVLLDIMMPGFTGVDVLERIRADPKLKSQSVAFLTVVHHLGEYGVDTLRRLDPAEYFVKPIDVADFKKRLKALLG